MAEKIISQRVVSKKVLGSANPIAKRFRNLQSAIGATCAAPIILLIAVVLLFYSEGFQKNSEVVEQLSLEKASEVTATSGMHKISGKPEITKNISAPQVGQVLYYDYTKQEYKEVEETEEETVTEIENGQEVEKVIETVKLVEKWVELESSKPKWADFKLGNIYIKPDDAQQKLDLTKKEYIEDLYGDYVEADADTTVTPELGDRRIIVNYVQIGGELIVIGEISKDRISGGEVFIVSNKTDAELLSDLKTTESFMYWGMKFLIWLLFTIGFSSIIAPVIALVDFIPFAGNVARSIAGFVSAVIALILVLLGTLLIKFWWLFIILMVVIVGGLIALAVSLAGKKKDKEGASTNEDQE